MARINIEDQFWIEVTTLAIALGDHDKAIGQAVRFFKLAQDRHREGRLIADDEFTRLGFSEKIIGTFAERTAEGIRCFGSSKHFEWLDKKRESGRKGAEKTNRKRWGIGKDQHKSANVGTSQHSSPSSSISISSSSSSKKPPVVPLQGTVGVELPELARIWNEAVTSRPKVRDWSEARQRAAKSLLVNKKTVGDFTEACRKVEASDFLSGRNGKWTSCNIDWLLKLSNLLKVLEGNYDNQDAPGKRGPLRIQDILAQDENGGAA